MFIVVLISIALVWSMTKMIISKNSDFKVSYLIGSLIICFFYFFYEEVPNAIPEGIYKAEATVIDEVKDVEEQVFVDFEIVDESDEGGKTFIYAPKTIYWPSGKYTILDETEYVSKGEMSTCYDKSGTCYKIEIPNIKFTFAQKLLSLGRIEIGLFAFVFLVGFVGIIFYLIRRFIVEEEL